MTKQSETEKKTTKRYTDEFKTSAIAQIKEGKPVAELATELGMHPSVLYGWRRAMEQSGEIEKSHASENWSLMPSGRRKYTDEYKQRAVARVKESGLSVMRVAAELGINDGNLARWVNDANKGSTKKARHSANGQEHTKRTSVRQSYIPRTHVVIPGTPQPGFPPEFQDGLIFLRQAEELLFKLVGEKKLKRPDQVHRLMLMAIGYIFPDL